MTENSYAASELQKVVAIAKPRSFMNRWFIVLIVGILGAIVFTTLAAHVTGLVCRVV